VVLTSPWLGPAGTYGPAGPLPLPFEPDRALPRDPFIREKFTRERTAARKLATEYFRRFPKDRYQTEVESWRNLQSANIEFTMKRLREPIEGAGR
jgi:hypothetical protein